MNERLKKAELLSPAGNPEKLRAAVLYGADAVYLSGKRFGMRAAADNFTDDEIAEAAEYCHRRGVRVYVTVNVMPRTEEYGELRRFIGFLSEAGADALIVSDLGVFSAVREIAPDMEIHVSTQASVTSAEACAAWHKMGAKRVVLARELSLRDVAEIRRNAPPELELETFVHGSMCVGYSGRCLLSNYFTGRDSNHGACAQPCRWDYSPSRTLDLREAQRPDEPVAVSVEEENGETFFMSSRDMCMIDHIPDLEESGISSYKIEGRMKSAYYAAVVTNAYRIAIDRYRRDPAAYGNDPLLRRELESVSHREYSTGFFYSDPRRDANAVTAHGYVRDKAYLAVCAGDCLTPDGDGTFTARFRQKNKASVGDPAEIITPGKTGRPFVIRDMRDADGSPIESAPHPSMEFTVKVPFGVRAGDIMRAGD